MVSGPGHNYAYPEDCNHPECSERRRKRYNAIIEKRNGEVMQEWKRTGVVCGSDSGCGHPHTTECTGRKWNSDTGPLCRCINNATRKRGRP